MDLNFKHLRYFWAVAHDGNLTRAAERLGVSQSALSIQIKALEDRLGHKLFLRQGRTLVLTEAGRIALDHADTIFAAGAELLGTLKGAGPSQQVLRVGALSTLSRNFQMAFLHPILGRSGVEVILRSGSSVELYAALIGLNLDVVLTTQPPPADGAQPFVARRLDAQPVSLIGPPARIEGHASDDLLAHAPLLLPTRESSIRVEFDALMARKGIAPTIAAEVDDMAMLRLLARAGAGLAVVSPIVVQDELTAGSLMIASELPLTETFYAVTVDRKFPNPLIGELLA